MKSRTQLLEVIVMCVLEIIAHVILHYCVYVYLQLLIYVDTIKEVEMVFD